MTNIKSKLDPILLNQHVDGMLVKHTAFTEILDQLNDAFEMAPHLKRSAGLFIVGESLTGKSTVAEKLAETHPPYRTEEGLVSEVVYVQVPSKPSVKGLATEILYALGDPLANKGTEHDKTQRILLLIKHCKTRMLILDEFHHFVDKASKYTVIHNVADWLKCLINQARLVTVIISLPYGQKVLVQNEQLRGRFNSPMIMPRFDWADDYFRAEFLGLLEGFTDMMRERFDVPDFHSEELAYRFYLASGGLTGYVFNILQETARDVIRRSSNVITMSDLDRNYLKTISEVDRHEVSPFSTHFNLEDGKAYENARIIGLRGDEYLQRVSMNTFKPKTLNQPLAY